MPVEYRAATYAAARARTDYDELQPVFIAGESATADGGQGVFYFDSTATGSIDDGRQLVVTSGGRLRRFGELEDANIVYVPRGGTTEIMAAHDLVSGRGVPGIVKLAPGVTYTIDGDGLEFETALVGLVCDGQAFLDCSGLNTDAVALLLRNSDSSSYVSSKWPVPLPYCGLSLVGDETDGRDFAASAVRCSEDSVSGNSVRAQIDRVRIRNFKNGLVIGNRAYMTRGQMLEVSGCKFGILQEASAVDFAENVSIMQSTIHDCDCLLKSLSGQFFRFWAVSFDYFGDSTGSRITSDDAMFDIRAGTRVDLSDCHLEWNYGKYSGQTQAPIRLSNGGTVFRMRGGTMAYGDATQQPYYPGHIQMSDLAQKVILDEVSAVKLGRISQATSDDALIVTTSGTGGVADVRGLRSPGDTANDLPSVVGYEAKMNILRNGLDYPQNSLSWRTTFEGSASWAAVTSQGSIVPKTATHFQRISGAGVTHISLKIYDWNRLHAWGFFWNGSEGVGSATVKLRSTSFIGKSNSTVHGIGVDTRDTFNGSGKTLTLGGSNTWERVSWKDVVGGSGIPTSMEGDVLIIEIDTSSMSSGYLCVDRFAFAPI